ncbi:MAG: DUF488 domain-containing protein [Flavobacteriales bacterium]|nr:DUF488 domain-containing protein [Flavobacteriales bacterium]HRO40049.1 DUF488 domain-containing protein [Flavobacteriales bacterium]HRP82719.1 DUF488 domain-containing protein [Flavobacteriales bacterium]
MEHEIWTIGHSTHPLEEFLAWLKAFRIEVLADVRSYPGSRRVPWFNKEVMPKELAAAGIEYVHVRALGGRRKVLKDSPNTVWRHPAFRGYADYMMNDPAFEQGLEELKGLALRQRTCMMCSEVLWWRCHRSMLADRLKADGWQVHHIEGLGQAEEHPWTGAARLRNGKLYYGPVEDPLPFARDL